MANFTPFWRNFSLSHGMKLQNSHVVMSTNSISSLQFLFKKRYLKSRVFFTLPCLFFIQFYFKFIPDISNFKNFNILDPVTEFAHFFYLSCLLHNNTFFTQSQKCCLSLMQKCNSLSKHGKSVRRKLMYSLYSTQSPIYIVILW